MSYTDVLQTIGIVIALVGQIPVYYSWRKLRQEMRAKLRCDVSWPLYHTEPPGGVFVTISVFPGVKAIRIDSVEAVGGSVRVADALSTQPKDPMACSLKGEPISGSVSVDWHIPSREQDARTLSAVVCTTWHNVDSLPQIALQFAWYEDTSTWVRCIHKKTVKITLITPNKERTNSAHAEISL